MKKLILIGVTVSALFAFLSFIIPIDRTKENKNLDPAVNTDELGLC